MSLFFCGHCLINALKKPFVNVFALKGENEFPFFIIKADLKNLPITVLR